MEYAPPKIVLVATYHRMIKSSVISRVGWAINLHPSLLPRGRGPNPFFWSLRNGDTKTGVTGHILSEEIDAGPILWRECIHLASGETQGTLRRRLADVAARGAVTILESLISSTSQNFIKQDNDVATYYGKPSLDDSKLTEKCTVDEAMRRFYAWTPYPGLRLGEALIVEMRANDSRNRGALALGSGWKSMRLLDGYISLRLMEEQ